MKKVKTLMAMLLSAALIVSIAPGQVSVVNAADAASSVSKPTVSEFHTVTWDCVYYGNYWQEDTNGDGKATTDDEKMPIKWRVLTVEGDYALLMSDKILDWTKFSDAYAPVGWGGSKIEDLLNHYFCHHAFGLLDVVTRDIKYTLVDGDVNPVTQVKGSEARTDPVYVLSYSEATKAEYGFDTSLDTKSKTRRAERTGFAVTQAGGLNPDLRASWWLSTPGEDLRHRIVIGEDGNALQYEGVNGKMVNLSYGVRPVLWLNLKACPTWSKAGTVQASSNLPATIKSDTKNSQKNSSTSKSTKKTAKAVVKGKAPKVNYKVKGNKLTVKYTAPKKAAGFQVRYKAKNGKWKVKTYNTKKSTSKSIRGLKKGKYTVQARSFTKGKKIYSKWSKAKTVNIKKATK